MPNDKEDRKARTAAKKDLREGKAASTAAGEFVREEMHHREEGRHGPNESREQAVAIGLAKARKAGVPLKRAPAAKSASRKKR